MMSIYKPKAVYAASERHYTAACGEVQYLGLVFTGDGRWSEEIDRRIGKCKTAWALSLCGHKTGAFKHRKDVSFQIGLCSDPYMVMNLG